MRELFDAGIRLSLRLGKIVFLILLFTGAFTYWGASVRMHRPATLTEWQSQMNRLDRASRYYYGQDGKTRVTKEMRPLWKSFGLNPDAAEIQTPQEPTKPPEKPRFKPGMLDAPSPDAPSPDE